MLKDKAKLLCEAVYRIVFLTIQLFHRLIHRVSLLYPCHNNYCTPLSYAYKYCYRTYGDNDTNDNEFSPKLILNTINFSYCIFLWNCVDSKVQFHFIFSSYFNSIRMHEILIRYESYPQKILKSKLDCPIIQ